MGNCLRGRGRFAFGLGLAATLLLLDDLSGRFTPNGAAKYVIHACKTYQVDRIVAEVNNGGDLVEALLRTVSLNFAYNGVHASRGKLTRAEPIAALYQQHRVHHIGTFGALEDQVCDYVSTNSKSPDRMDALVWALTELTNDVEEELFFKYSDIPRITPELDAFEDFSRF